MNKKVYQAPATTVIAVKNACYMQVGSPGGGPGANDQNDPTISGANVRSGSRWDNDANFYDDELF